MKVEVVTATAGPERYTTPDGNIVIIHRLAQNKSSRHGIRSKASGYLSFIRHAREEIRELITPGDSVVAMTDPPLLGPAIGQIVRSQEGRMWHWSQDLYPEVALAIAPFGPITALLGLLRPWRNYEWKKSQGLVAIGEDMAGRIRQNRIIADRVHVVPNWAPRGLDFEKARAQREKWGRDDQDFIVAYSGNLGRAHVLTPLISLAAECRPDKRTKLLIIGRGAQRSLLEKLASDQKLGNCIFLPPVPRDDLGASLAAADVHVITMRPDCVGTVWPSKFYGVVAAGRPIIFIGPPEAEIAQIVTIHKLGIAIPPALISQARNFINTLTGDRKVYDSYQRRVVKYAQSLKGLNGAVASWHEMLSPK